jgi:amino acid adenylation domain-containing protein/non-ribosomal peptide synthase protein (TIGR01720 family)
MTVAPQGQKIKSAVDKKRLLEMMLKKKGLKSKDSSQKNDIVSRESDDLLVLSSAQQRLWFLEEFTVDTAAYVFCNKVDLKGDVNLDALRKAYQAIADRHEIFRTSYQQKEGVPHQFIHSDIKIDIPLIDLSDRDELAKQKEYDSIAHKESTQPFKLNTAPLMRMCIVKLEPNHHIVLQTIHHIVYDGWSLAVMYEELKSLYEAYIQNKSDPLPALDIQYADFAHWQKENLDSPDMQKQLEFWKQTLGGDLPVLELLADKPRPTTQSYNGALHKIKLTEALSESLRVFALKNECTLSMVMLTAFKILLHRYTGETDLLVGMPVANRNHKQIESLIGFFVNSLVLRTSLEFDPDVEELLSRVRTSSSKAYSHQDLPFDRIVDELQPARDLSHNPIFQVMFAFQNTPDLPRSMADIQMDLEVLDNNTSVFDLTLNLHDSVSGIYGYIEYCNEIFDADTIERMQGHYQTILEGMIANPKSKISQLQLVTKAESHQLLNEWNNTNVDYVTDRCVNNVIEGQAATKPEAIAVCHQNERLTYEELNSKANQLAHHLYSKGVKPDTIVGICMERSCDMFVSILAVLKSGGAYLPLDPSYPSDRLTFMMKDSGADILLTCETLLENLPEHNAEIVCVDRDWQKISDLNSENLLTDTRPDHLAYIIYTSGSTGKPKGVMVSHRNLVHSTSARIHYYQHPMNKFLLLSSFAFDSSVAGIFWTLCQGGELHLPEQGMEKDIMQVASLLQQAEATHMLSLPSIYSLLLSVAEPGQLKSLNTIIVAGEACPPELLVQHASELPHASLYNEYGPTEGSVWSTVYKMPVNESLRQVPIGRPIPNVKTYILDKNLQPVPVGVIGEIYIGGAGITRGYLNREDLTREKFITNPFTYAKNDRLYQTGDLAKYQADANIQFCGRTDDQVKIRGYRIELGEIESALLKHDGVEEVVVIAREQAEKKSSQPAIKTKRLMAYIISKDDVEPEIESLQQLLKESLPDYMVPQSITFIDRIPLSPNGKVDVKALPDSNQQRTQTSAEFAKASNEVEEKLTEIWSSVLGVDVIGVHDNFFEIGGDSILSIQIIARTKEAGIHLTPKQVFQNLTIYELARVAETEQSITAEQGAVTGNVPLIPIQHWLLERELPHPDHWNQAAMLRVPKNLNLDTVYKAVEYLAQHHDALRAHFTKKDDHWIQSFSDSVSISAITINDLSALKGDEQIQALTREASAVQASLDIGAGQLLAMAHFNMGDNAADNRLFIAVHHLVIDTVSWMPLIEDLETLYQQLNASQKIRLPEKTTSYKDWSNILYEYVLKNMAKAERSYWLSLPDKDVFSVPLDYKKGNNTEASQKKHTVSLTAEETQWLLKDVPPVYNTKIDDILLTAMAQTINNWTGHNILSLGMEGHGREQISDHADLSRTIGWFTSYFPVALLLDKNHPGDAIKAIKEQLRAIPNHGIGFGMLRYLEHNPEVIEKLKSINQENILYNYLGQFGAHDQKDAIFVMTDESCGHDHDLSGPRSHILEIDSMIMDNQLKLDWVFSENLHDFATIEHLANHYIQTLRELIQHCQSPEAGGFSASDFPEADLDQDDLEDLLGMLED